MFINTQIRQRYGDKDMSKILLVEDSEDSYNLIRRAISPELEIEWKCTYFEASSAIQSNFYDLIILDVLLPDGNGLDLANSIQSQPHLKLSPIIFISTKDSVNDIVTGFTVGADDYITKPFNIMELKARINSKLKKMELLSGSRKKLNLGPINVNLTSHSVYLKENQEEQKLDLTPIEYKILTYLLSQPGQVFSRSEILDKIWGKNIYVYPRSVDTHVSKLRKKLGTHSDLIESVHGSGYKIKEV